MRTLLWVALVAGASGASCSKAQDIRPGEAAQRAPAEPRAVSVDELARLLASGEYQAVDANSPATRQNMGIIPGAILLTDYDNLDKLPSDRSKGLVFYCANPQCGASEAAAAQAVTAGYTKVKVLPDGIAGWVKAGKQTASL